MEQAGHKQKDLAKLLGSRSRASEVLSGKCPLSLDMIRTLHEEWGIPLASLVGRKSIRRGPHPSPHGAGLR
jgi:HTH-type transcriptional regulator/antitoxin HigA